MQQSITIANIDIQQDGKGRYCLNDLHRAAGALQKHKPANFLRIDGTKALIAEINQCSDVSSAYINVGGASPGTFVSKELVYAYAMWISAAFHLRVIRAYDSANKPATPAAHAELTRMEILQIAMESEKGRLVAVEQLAIASPKADALDLLTLADGSMCITNAAKAVSKQPKAMFAWLQANDWIYRRPGGVWCAYQDRIKSGMLTHKITTVSRSDGTEKIVEQVLVTAKGLAKLAEVTI